MRDAGCGMRDVGKGFANRYANLEIKKARWERRTEWAISRQSGKALIEKSVIPWYVRTRELPETLLDVGKSGGNAIRGEGLPTRDMYPYPR